MERFEWSLRVASAQRDRATVFARKHSFEVGVPVSFDTEYDRLTALEYVLGAFGADLVLGLQRSCRLRRLKVDTVEAVVHGELDNPAVYLGVVGEEGRPGLSRASLRVYVDTVEDESKVQDAWTEALRLSPLADTLRGSVSLELVCKVSI